ncbi:MAG: exopolyphosphatase [Bacteroidia bacterium]|nr:exopolyphosphatase [Bacteroidia bacterium]
MRIATIDLGTNTCHLLIAEVKGSSHEDIYHETFAVKLGEGGITENKISPPATNRAVTAFENYLSVCKKHNVEKLYATATAAVRQANNKNEIIDQIKSHTGIILNVIDGDTEASLIYEGVKLALPQESESALMMDIGGGSVEFIITMNGEKVWQKSFPTGAAFLLEKFKPPDPISELEVELINTFLMDEWIELFEHISNHSIKHFIGASGSFQTLCDLHNKQLNSVAISTAINNTVFSEIYHLLLKSDRHSRLKLDGMKAMRVDMIVLSVIMIKLILDKVNCDNIFYSNFALKEGLCNLLLLEPDNLIISNFNYLKP